MTFSSKISVLVVFGVLLVTSVAHAEGTYINNFCFRWQAGWSDSYVGYDHLETMPPGGMLIPNIPVRVEISTRTPWGETFSKEVRHMRLNHVGCLQVSVDDPLPSSPEQRHFRFQFPLEITETVVESPPPYPPISKKRGIRILSNDTHDKRWVTSTSAENEQETISVESVEVDYVVRQSYETPANVPFPADWITIPDAPQTKAFILAHRFWQNRDMLNMPWNSEIRIAHTQDLADTDEDAYYPGCESRENGKVTSNTSMVGKSIGGGLEKAYYDLTTVARICMGSGIRQRRTVLHEIGHALHNLQNVSISGDYHADEPEAAMSEELVCKAGRGSVDLAGSSRWTPTRNSWGREIREWVGRAAEEGFADFVAYAARLERNLHTSLRPFNKRSDPFEASGRWNVGPVTNDYNLSPHNMNPADPERYWTQRFCRPPDSFPHLGSPRDWSRFYWGLWADPVTTRRFNVSEIHDLWKSTEPRLHVHCVPVRTTHEENWTCKNGAWAWPIIEIYTYSTPDGSRTGVRQTAVASKKFDVGRTYTNLKEAAETRYTTPGAGYDLNKYQYFEETALAAGVEYQ